MRTADNQRLEALRRILCHAKPDPPAHRIPPEMCRGKIEGVEDCNDILAMQGQRIRSRIVRFITCSMPPGIHEDELVVGFQGVDIPGPRPALHVPGKPVLKDQERPFALDSVVDTDALIGRVRHGDHLRFPKKPGLWVGWSDPLKDHHRPENLAPFHFMERRFHVADGDGLGNEPLQV